MNKWQAEVQKSLLASEEAAIKELEKQYARALKDINNKVKMFQADIDMLDQALQQEGLDEAAKAVLKSQRKSKIYQQDFQKSLRAQISAILDKMQGDNYSTIDSYLKQCYEDGFIGTLYDLANQGVPVIAPIDQTAAVQAILTDSKVSKGLYNALGVDVGNLKKSISQEISRGIASALSYSDIARNISNKAKAPMSRAKTIARTEGHRIQQKSSADAANEARARGADLVKVWDAVLDGKTRPSHRRVDGEIRELDEKFSNGLKYPGDPSGRAGEVVNCRCIRVHKPRWDAEGGFAKIDNFTKEVMVFESAKDYAEFKERYWSKENLDYMKYTATLEKRYGTKDFKAIVENMTDREYQHLKKLEAANPMLKSVKATTANKMATSSTNNDWSKTVPKTITKQQRTEIVQYAKDKGINIGNIKDFDGEPELLKSQIEALSRISSELPIGKKISLSVVKMDDVDFGESSQEAIRINLKALRDRKITETNILNGQQFASTKVEDIAVHEYGHVFVLIKGNKGLEIARKAYYNVFGESATDEAVAEFLYEHVSPYALKVTGRNNLPEIIPEVLAKNNSNPSEFTQAFVELLKGI